MMTLKKLYRFAALVYCLGCMFLVTLAILFRIQTSYSTAVDPVVYDLPFESGKVYRIMQGYGGVFSHYHAAALDFDMPSGTLVCAAREGEVYRFRDDSRVGGPFEKYRHQANFLIIRHYDGSFGCYWHLQRNGVLVKNGRVKRGQPIARSGATGFVLEPHLHFTVKTRLSYDPDSYLQTLFHTVNGNQLLQAYQWYAKPGSPFRP